MGALYDAVSVALRRLHKIRFDDLPRMADAVVWVTAAEPAFGWEHGTFKAAYECQTTRLSQRAVEADVLGSAITDLLADEPSWSGTATELLHAVVSQTAKHLRNRLPATAASLGQRLRRLRPDLKTNGIDVQCGGREGHESARVIRLQRTGVAARAGRTKH